MRRVVVTGLGIVSSIGNNADEVTASLREARSGIVRAEKYAELGFRCQVHGAPTLNPEEKVDRRAMRFHSTGTAWNHVAMDQAIADSGLEAERYRQSAHRHHHGFRRPFHPRDCRSRRHDARQKAPSASVPSPCPRRCRSTASATLATWFKIKGVNYSISSACATSSHCIGNAAEMIQYGKQDVMFAGGCEELDWTLSVLFDAMGAMSSSYNDTPATASRAYDQDRDGFVIAGGAGVLVLEEYERAKARGAKIYAELAGYGLTSDGHDMVAPSGEGAERCMRMALATCKAPIDYINPHATATPVGDLKEIEALRAVFGADKCPPISRHQVADRPFPRRGRRAGGDLFAADATEQFHLRKRQYQHSRPGLRGYEHLAPAAGQQAARRGSVQLLRFWRHQRHADLQTCRRLTESCRA